MTYRVHDNGVDRDATAEEIVEIEAREAEAVAAAQAAAEKAALRETALAKLGLTADEAAALFG